MATAFYLSPVHTALNKEVCSLWALLWPAHFIRNDNVQALTTDTGTILAQSYDFPKQY